MLCGAVTPKQIHFRQTTPFLRTGGKKVGRDDVRKKKRRGTKKYFFKFKKIHSLSLFCNKDLMKDSRYFTLVIAVIAVQYSSHYSPHNSLLTTHYSQLTIIGDHHYHNCAT